MYLQEKQLGSIIIRKLEVQKNNEIRESVHSISN